MDRNQITFDYTNPSNYANLIRTDEMAQRALTVELLNNGTFTFHFVQHPDVETDTAQFSALVGNIAAQTLEAVVEYAQAQKRSLDVMMTAIAAGHEQVTPVTQYAFGTTVKRAAKSSPDFGEAPWIPKDAQKAYSTVALPIIEVLSAACEQSKLAAQAERV